MCDRKGVIYQGRTEGMDQWKSAHAVQTDPRTLDRGDEGRRRLPGPLGRRRAEARTWSRPWPTTPIIFAMANPDPEITPPRRAAVAPTRSSPRAVRIIPNQVNNVLGFPFIFRGALDVRARAINEEMKIAPRQCAGGTRARACAR